MSDVGGDALERILASLGAYRLDFNRITLRSDVDDLGSGGYGTVKLGSLRDWTGQETTLVAVKVLRPPGQNRTYRTTMASRLAREAKVWARLIHPNILRLVGFCLNKEVDEAWLISSYASYGNLSDYLSKTAYDLIRKLELSLDIAQGLVYLHTSEPTVVHGDLKPANVVIGKDGCAKLCDFGLAKVLDDPTGLTSTTTIKGSPRYMSPELLEQGACLTIYSDIWAFGCLVGEVLSGTMPYHSESSHFRLMLRIMGGEQPLDLKLLELPEAVVTLLESCWGQLPDGRCLMSICVAGLSSLLSSLGGSQTTKTTNQHETELGAGLNSLHLDAPIPLSPDRMGISTSGFSPAPTSPSTPPDVIRTGHIMLPAGPQGLKRYLTAKVNRSNILRIDWSLSESHALLVSYSPSTPTFALEMLNGNAAGQYLGLTWTRLEFDSRGGVLPVVQRNSYRLACLDRHNEFNLPQERGFVKGCGSAVWRIGPDGFLSSVWVNPDGSSYELYSDLGSGDYTELKVIPPAVQTRFQFVPLPR